jgi:hypothetical protein
VSIQSLLSDVNLNCQRVPNDTVDDNHVQVLPSSKKSGLLGGNKLKRYLMDVVTVREDMLSFAFDPQSNVRDTFKAAIDKDL